jgi:hypothetical protein
VAPELGGDVGLLVGGLEMQDLAAHGFDAAHVDQAAQVGDGDAGAFDADDLEHGAHQSITCCARSPRRTRGAAP